MKLLILKIDKLNLLLRLVIQSSYANFNLTFSNYYSSNPQNDHFNSHRIKSKLNYKHSDRVIKLIFKFIESSQTQFPSNKLQQQKSTESSQKSSKVQIIQQRIVLTKMQEENHRKKLLQSPHNIEMAQFPSYNLQQSRNTNKSLNSLEQQMSLNDSNPNILGKQQLKAIPEIFLLGGNKDLNLKLWKIRQQKLSRIALNEPIIECENLGKVYKLEGEDEVVALKNITLKGNEINGGIKRGQFVIIRGPSGGGKTTFLNLLGTIDRPTHGHIWIDNEMIDAEHKDQKLSKLRRDKIGIVFQTFNLLALMSAYENIQLPMRIKGIESQKAMKERTKLLLKRVGLMERAEHLPSQLSGGEQQRVAIARSLANQPAIILLDEPTGDLDSRSTVQVMNLLLQINNLGYHNSEEGQFRMSANNPGITIVMVTHNEDLQCYGDRVIFFEDGKIKRQVFNDFQFALDPQQYSQFLNTKV